MKTQDIKNLALAMQQVDESQKSQLKKTLAKAAAPSAAGKAAVTLKKAPFDIPESDDAQMKKTLAKAAAPSAAGKAAVTLKKAPFDIPKKKMGEKKVYTAAGQEVDGPIQHDCATHVEHAEWGEGNPISEQHTIVETAPGVGHVTHYDVMFEHGVEKNVAVEDLTILAEMSHGHSKKKKNEGLYASKKMTATKEMSSKEKMKRGLYNSTSEAVITKGSTVIATKGPHKGDKHEVIHDFGDGHVNVMPMTHKVRYPHGAAKAKISDLKLVEAKMDPVGQADADIDNDGDVDKSDKYLKNRRKAISKNIKKDEADEVIVNPKSKDADVGVNEVSNKTLDNYGKAALNDVMKRRSNRPAGQGDESDPKIAKRLKGMKTQMKKQGMKEEQELRWPILARIQEKASHKDGAPAETAMDKVARSGKGAKDMAADLKMDNPEVAGDEAALAKTNVDDAAKSTKKAPARNGDNTKGDTAIIKSATPTKGDS